MPDDRKKMFSKKGTGTVPKIKHRNNTSHVNQADFQRNLSNNLGLDWQRHDYSNYSRNCGRNFYQLNPFPMETSLTNDHRQNGIAQINMPGTANGTLSTSSTSDSNSRRDSVGTIPKCDNVQKCPDKKQIEDKLSQIREYLQVTTSLMSSIKNEDQSADKEQEDFEKMIKDLKDSEAKLLVLLSDPFYDESVEEPTVPIVEEENHNMDIAVSEHMQRFSQLLDILACQQDKFNNMYNTNNGPLENGMDTVSEPSVSRYQRNELEEKVEFTNRKMQLLRDQQNALLNLKRKAENQLRDARQAQENLLLMQQQQQKPGNQLRNTTTEQERIFSDSLSNDKNSPENHFDAAIKELEERLDSMRNDTRRSTSSSQDNARADGDFIQERLDDRNQLLHLLDNRDTQLNGEHVELQRKLTELQTKKLQIDQLAQQLQNLGDEDDEDIGNQVRKIVTMKQQLSSLKDLLEIVKNTEFSLLDSQNVNELELECQDNAHAAACTKTDNIRQDVRTNRNQNENSARLENNAARANDQWVTDKQSNKSLINIQEREKVLAELKAKKRELEEIMYKQKDRTSINNDVCSEPSVNKADLGANNHVFDTAVLTWLPVHPNQHNQVTSAYSSDDCPEEDINEYSDLNSSADVTVGTMPQAQPLLSSNYSTPSFSKRRHGLEQGLDRSCPSEFLRHSSPRTSERCAPAGPVPAPLPAFERERTLSNTVSETDGNKFQLQKQLELIQCVCQSLLDQQACSNVQQLRNNLTPSPMYTEPRSYMSANPRQNNVLNTANPVDMSYVNPPPVNSQCFALGEVANNQNMLAANTLQTQAFLLNTLNQCCQMLWFQQREIASLRSMICTMQEQMVNGQPEQDPSLIPPLPSSYVFPARPVSSLSNFRAPSQPRNVINPKVNQVSAACSLPNLNPSGPHANIDSAYMNQSNVRSSPSARLLESSLNNTAPLHSHHNLSGDPPANNTMLPSVNVNASISQPLPSQIWNGQALNNQVAPGNRANNYWDNFRSYSRQNLLSTTSKSNEGLQNPTSATSVLDRSNITYDRSHSFSLHPFTVPKLNMVHNESTTASEESTPRRHLHFKPPQNLSSNKVVPAIPPDVLNINHNSTSKANEHGLSREIPVDIDAPENNLLLDLNGAAEDASSFKDCSIGSHRNRNEWHDNEQSDSSAKSKLFEELRDNVYKEVANLISANENRPHFLIQLFRDLQHINSDPLRGRTLQSIQTVITNSLNVLEITRGASRQATTVQPVNSEQEVVQVDSEYFSLQPSLWPQSPVSTSRDSSNMELETTEDPDIHNILKTIFSFLKSHHDDVLHQELIDLLKEIIVKTMPFAQIFASTSIQERTFHKHFAGILNEAFEKFHGRRIAEIKKDLLKTISDILVGEFSFIYMVQENTPENCQNLPLNSNILPVPDNTLSLNLQPPQVGKIAEDGSTPQMQNGDLAEADQSRAELQEEEGAVGGVLNVVVEANPINAEFVEPDVTDLPRIDCSVNAESEVEFTEQGLDQVPTRLTTGSHSHSNTPSRDRSTSRSDPLEHF